MSHVAARSVDSDSDVRLVARARAGDREAFGLLSERHRPLAMRVARRMLRDDGAAGEAVQEAVLLAYLSLDRLREDARFSGWLCGIVLNLCRSYVRDGRNSTRSLETLSGHDFADRSGDGDPERVYEERELQRTVLDAVTSLTAANRDAALLFYYRQLSVREIAAALGISVSAVKVRLNRARSRLRESLVHMAAERHPRQPARRRGKMAKVTVADVVRDPGKDDDSEGDRHSRSKTVVVLADESSRRFLPIWVGESEGTAIAIGARELSAPRPLTYPFVARLLEAGGVSVREVRVDRLDGNTFYAKVELAGGSSPGEVDARPSDAIALAMQTGAPIYVADEVMESAGFDAPEHAGGDTERGRGLDAIVAEVEEWLKPRDPQHSISQEERDESYRRLLALIFGTDA